MLGSASKGRAGRTCLPGELPARHEMVGTVGQTLQSQHTVLSASQLDTLLHSILDCLRIIIAQLNSCSHSEMSRTDLLEQVKGSYQLLA